jgi:tripartite-type tricarboxylate transporter receptor subunit TctC
VNKLFGNLHAVIRRTLPTGAPKEIDAKFNNAVNSVLKDKELYELFIQREINRVVDNLYLSSQKLDNESK